MNNDLNNSLHEIDQIPSPGPEKPLPNIEVSPGPEKPLPNTDQVPNIGPEKPLPNIEISPGPEKPLPNADQVPNIGPEKPLPNIEISPGPEKPLPNTDQVPNIGPEKPLPNIEISPGPEKPLPNTDQVPNIGPEKPLPNIEISPGPMDNPHPPKGPKIVPHKKNKLILAICIVLPIISIIILLIIFAPKLLDLNIGDEKIKISSDNNELKSTSTNWDDWELMIDDNIIKLPMKYEDFIKLGFDVEYSELANNINYSEVRPTYSYGTYTQGKTLYTNGKIGLVNPIIYNPTDEYILTKDSIIIGIEFNNVYKPSNGNIKLLNKTKKTEVTFGKSSAEDIEKAFGQHYKYDKKNVFHYYVNSDNDSKSLSGDCFISLECDSETGILDTSGFFYTDKGNSKNVKINKSPEKYKIPKGYEQIKSGVNKIYRKDDSSVDVNTLIYWKYDNSYDDVKDYIENNNKNISNSKIFNNKKYGEIFVIEDDEYHYQRMYSYYVVINKGEYLLQVASSKKINGDNRIGHDKALEIALEFVP